MELNITEIFGAIDTRAIFNSVANLGADAARITWNNAMSAATGLKPLDTPGAREAFRQYAKGLGAWDDAEISAWTPLELNALALDTRAIFNSEANLAAWTPLELNALALDTRAIFNSVANLGADAARITWNSAMSAATGLKPLQTAEQREAFRRYVKGFGGWTADEISAWTPLELNALALQCIAAEMREGGLDDGATWEEYEASGNAGALYRGDDGQVYFSMEA